MQLLDATLGLALTLAALAMIVTIILELGMRTARMRKKNLVEVMKLLNKELDNGLFNDLDADERWQFISKVINNPGNGSSDQLSNRLASHSRIEIRHSSVNPKLTQIVEGVSSGNVSNTEDKLTDTELNQLLDQIGYDKSAGKNVVARIVIFVRQAFGDSKRATLYDKVSLEHVLRRLAEIDKVKERSVAARKKARTELNRLARKYEEYTSAISASFKRSAQAGSIGVGILFAIVVNIDGLRIFEAYRTDPDLVRAIIEQQQGLIASYNGVEQRQQQYNKAQIEVDEALAEAAQAKQAMASATTDSDKSALALTVKEKEMALLQAKAKLDGLDSVNQMQQNAEHAQQQLAKLVAIGVPIGWTLYPNCPNGESGETWKSADPRCRTANDQNIQQTAGTFLQWLFAVVLTGGLLGLAAPFWFDVAKRMAQIRQRFRSSASDEIRMSGNNANGSEIRRKKIVKNIVSDIARENRSKR